MPYSVKPLGCDPARVKGMSERLIISHYENNYGGAVKRLNLIEEKLAELDYAPWRLITSVGDIAACAGAIFQTSIGKDGLA